MTLIEFFQETIAENICSSFVLDPDRVVLIGAQSKNTLNRHAKRYHEFFSSKGKEIEFISRPVPNTKIAVVLDAFEALIMEYPDCIFDLTGGDDLYLFAAGIIRERHPNIRMHRIDIRSGNIEDCDLVEDKTGYIETALNVTVEENVRLFGGCILLGEGPGKTHRWDMQTIEQYHEDVWQMWEICRVNCTEWNQVTSALAEAEKYNDSENPLEAKIPKSLESNKLIAALEKGGFIKKHCEDPLGANRIYYLYKNEIVKRCLTNSGLLLELVVFMSAATVKGKDRQTPFYNDVMTSVRIDWDGKLAENPDESNGISNEIDVIMMRGMIPLFVSCKNGSVEMEELYKLNSVAVKFGGKYVRKVLIASCLDPNNSSQKGIYERAKELSIVIVDYLPKLERKNFDKQIKNLFTAKVTDPRPGEVRSAGSGS